MRVDLDELERLEKAAMPGEWDWFDCGDDVCDCRWINGDQRQVLFSSRGCGDAACNADMALIVATRNALPAIIAEFRAHRELEEAAVSVLAALPLPTSSACAKASREFHAALAKLREARGEA